MTHKEKGAVMSAPPSNDSRSGIMFDANVVDYSLTTKGLDIKSDALSPTEKHLPIHTLSVETQAFVRKLAEVFQVSEDFATVALFVAVGAVMGNKYKIRDRKGYVNTLALWVCIVAVSGYGKTPVVDAVMKPLINRQAALLAQYKSEVAAWEKDGKLGKRPTQRKVFISDSTPEALYKVLGENPNGILINRDELAGWVNDFCRYNNSGEVEALLSIWSGKAVDTSRITREGNFIQDPCLSVLGGTQPDRLAKVFGKDVFLTSGFNARILWCYPDATPQLTYNECSIGREYTDWWSGLVDRLYQLDAQEVALSDDAHRLYVEYWESLQRKKVTADPYTAQVLSKLQIYVEKWAGITYLLSEGNRDFNGAAIDGESMRAAIDAMALFEKWAAKVYDKMVTSETMNLNTATLLRLLNEKHPFVNQTAVADGMGVSKTLVSLAVSGKR